MTAEEAKQFLPQKKVGSQPNPLSLIYTIIAEPKWGKTSWMSQIPNSLLLAFERGHSFIEAYKINITAWAKANSTVESIDDVPTMTFLDAVEIICASDQYDFIIFDTADMAAKMCLDYHLKKNGLVHQQDWDYGKGSDVCLNTPFRQAVNRLTASGRGVGFITHTETRDSRFSSGTKARKECSLPSGLVKYIIPQSDIVLHGKFGSRNPKTKKRDRILITEGSDDVLAGNRVQGKFRLPSRFIVDPDQPWEQWESFFKHPEAASEAEATLAKVTQLASTETEPADDEKAKEKQEIKAATKPPKGAK